ncbi:hypothetical protein KI387_033705 [Taxus chinensis]|uniref:Receptor-like serine/threonine-protein kinase n=1 Tax=Taxus chinensis TaxID=29808 RepID=A0AA38BYJ1_TAXCH|nr:hypothetical protein KI387_033705 [Taxus chinensis]
MAATRIIPPLIFIQMFMAISVSPQKNKISIDSTLTPSKNSKWVSPNGQFAFGFYPISPSVYALGVWFHNIPPKTLAWTAMKDESIISIEEDSTLQFSDTGLNLYDAQRNFLWSAAPSEKVVAAAMMDNGCFVLLNASSQPIWRSFDYPTDTLLPGQTLIWKSIMYSTASTSNYSTSRFQLSMQGDGNLVLYPVVRVGTSQGAYWSSGTFKSGDNPTSLNFDPSGVLYLVNSTNITVATLTKGETGAGQFLRRVTLDGNGILGQYVWNLNSTDQTTTTWSSVWLPVKDYCKDVKGQCGINGICRLTTDNKPDCLCPPQFSFIDNKDHFKGCVPKSFPGQSCAASSPMSQVDPNTDWTGGGVYSVLKDLSESGCVQACKEDCMCIVVTYEDTFCTKKQLPLLDGRQGTDITNKAYVKVSYAFQAESPAPPHIPQQQRKEREQKENGNGKGKGKTLAVFGISLLAGSSILLAATFLVISFNRYGYKASVFGEQHKVVEGLSAYSYKEIDAATGHFREELGRGAFGKVYKGTLPDGKAIAVKTLDKAVQQAEDEHPLEREFRTEMSVIGTCHHKNLVQLYGFCDEGSHRLLVYEYMSNGSLDKALFVDTGFLDWSMRFQIAVGTARGMRYLHEECRTQILHCDIKPQNILLDHIYSPKLSDFGLAKLFKAEQTRTFTGARGTKGYIAPEWYKNLPITVKVDVYSFGEMLLEIICCRISLDLDAPQNEIVLSDWVYECLKNGGLAKLVEQQQAEGITIESRQLERMVLVGLWCIQDDPSLRPSMKMVVQMLEGTVDIAVPPSPTSFGS